MHRPEVCGGDSSGVPVARVAAEVVNVPRTVTHYVARQQTVNQTVTRIEMVPVTRKRTQVHYETVMKTVTESWTPATNAAPR